MLRCLWLARTMPFPYTAGDRIYTGRLAEAFAAAGADITFVGLEGAAPPTAVPGIAWRVVPGGLRGQVRSLFSLRPLVSKRHETPAYHAEVRRLAQTQRWDAVIIDQYGMGWTLRYRAEFQGHPAFVFLTHDHEETVTRLQYRSPSASLPKRLYFAQNYLKTRAIERATARRCDLITVITDADGQLFRSTAPGAKTLTLTPGYAGPRVSERTIDASTRRAIVILSSFRWSAKQENLRLLLDHVDRQAHRAGVGIRVVGDAPADFMDEIHARYRAVHMTGYVEDPTEHLEARLALLAEPIGGGFKMKLLDYIFRRIPIAALDACVEGLPASVRRAVLCRPDLDSLMREVLQIIDDPSRLQEMQTEAFQAAEGAFSWNDRGRRLMDSLVTLHPAARPTSDRPSSRPGVPAPA